MPISLGLTQRAPSVIVTGFNAAARKTDLPGVLTQVPGAMVINSDGSARAR
jgi:hypothetical protein